MIMNTSLRTFAKLGVNCLLIAAITTMESKHVKSGEDRIIKSVGTIGAWTRDKVTINQVRGPEHNSDAAYAYAAYAEEAVRRAATATADAANATEVAVNNEAFAAYAAEATAAAATTTTDAANAIAAAKSMKDTLKHRAERRSRP
jgi:hypothetical protein